MIECRVTLLFVLDEGNKSRTSTFKHLAIFSNVAN